MLRTLLGVNAMAAAAALVRGAGFGDWATQFVALSAWVQPLLLLNLLVLAAAAPLLLSWPLALARAGVIGLAALSSLFLADAWRFFGLDGGDVSFMRAALFGGLAAALMLAYFALRARAFSPAIAEARLLALTARIRPHFLFNSLNAVLGLIRSEPRRAETALEELAELFRVLMRDPRELLPLADEIAFCRQYLDLEKLRLGERLRVDWDVRDVPANVAVPPLMLQPLLENAVYHGIEPLAEGGTLQLRFAREDDSLRIELINPCASAPQGSGGHHMAIANIRERLDLFYDLEARLDARQETLPEGGCQFCVRIAIPLRRRQP
ncbi:sensor histidine kinase [Propionivibrio dicarboxylicus]|nr:histidine kinase [Propionivibrio dicarboxylicus]